MGRDKALLEFRGKPQIEIAHDLLLGPCAKIFLSKREDQKLPADLCATINDNPKLSGHGPLSGILSAMEHYPEADWLVLACDLPFVTKEVLETLVAGRDPQQAATAFISSQDGLPEPLCAIWERHAYPHILKLFKEGVHCPRKVLIKMNAHLLKQKDPHWLDNINTPEEYEEIMTKIE